MFKKVKKELIYMYCKGVVKLYKIYLLKEDQAKKVNKVVEDLKPLRNKMEKAQDQRLRKLAMEMFGLQLGYVVYHIPKMLEELEQEQYERFIKMRWCE